MVSVLRDARIGIDFSRSTIVNQCTDAIPERGRHDDARRTSAKFSSAQTGSCFQHDAAVCDLPQTTELLGRARRDASGVGRRVDPVLHAAPQVTRQITAYSEQHPFYVAFTVEACFPKAIHEATTSRFTRLAKAQSRQGDSRGVEPARVEQDFTLLRQFAAAAVLGSSPLESVDSCALRYRDPAGLDVVGTSLGYPERLPHSTKDETETGDRSQAACRHAGSDRTTSRTRERAIVPVAVQTSPDLARVREDSQGCGSSGRPSKPVSQTEKNVGDTPCRGRRDRSGRTAPRPCDSRAGTINLYRSTLHAAHQSCGRIAASLIQRFNRIALVLSSPSRGKEFGT